MLTHANATVEEAVPYMQTHATKVLTVAGRSAKVETVCEAQQAVMWGWRDCLLPLMSLPPPVVLRKSVTVGASYLWPPTGSYASHQSGCQVGNPKNNVKQGLTKEGVRKADWGYPNEPFTRVPLELINKDRDTQRPGEKWLRASCCAGQPLVPQPGSATGKSRPPTAL